jgi:hypothetical protein
MSTNDTLMDQCRKEAEEQYTTATQKPFDQKDLLAAFWVSGYYAALYHERRKPTGPIVTHLAMDPDASPETIAAVGEVVKAAYAYKVPTKKWEGLTDAEIDRLVREEPSVMCAGSSLEWDNGAIAGMRYLRDHYAPPGTLTVEQVMQVVDPWYLSAPDGPRDGETFKQWVARQTSDLREALTAKAR